MGDTLKKVASHLFRLQFWTILFLETIIVGGVLIYVDYVYDDDTIPSMLITLHFPFFGVLMLIGGIYSMYRLFTKIDLISVLVNAAIWRYVAVACGIQLLDTTIVYDQGFNSILLVLSAALCIRIICNAYYLDLHKEGINSKEHIDGKMG